MNKQSLTEADIRTKFITPALVGANGDKWNLMTQIREEAYFTKGRVIVRGKSVKRGDELMTLDGGGCRFRTAYPATVWPIDLTAASYKDPPFVAPPNCRPLENSSRRE